MIIDTLKAARTYPYDEAWEKAFDFLENLSPEAEEKRYDIDGDLIYAMVMECNTVDREEAFVEAHRMYLDIHMTLSGAEIIECFPLDAMVVKEAYNVDKDAEFFEKPKTAAVKILNKPGQVSIFFPQDVHMPMIHLLGTERKLKKVVVKVALDLI